MRLVARTPARDAHLRRLYAAFGGALGVWIPFVAIVLQARRFDPAQVGLLLGCNSLGTVLATPVWSSLADRYIGSARALRYALVAGAMASLGLAFSDGSFSTTAALFVGFGATVGATTGLIDSLALEHLGGAREIRYGAFRLFGSLGWAVVVTSLGAVLQVTG
ncbi:MAG TPA: MFS transporter, partial [Candidatus Dormibacteraeota bacterium]|nr:MFS transporter [Candidatus Dormibacteraeota bacterium]